MMMSSSRHGRGDVRNCGAGSAGGNSGNGAGNARRADHAAERTAAAVCDHQVHPTQNVKTLPVFL